MSIRSTKSRRSAACTASRMKASIGFSSTVWNSPAQSPAGRTATITAATANTRKAADLFGKRPQLSVESAPHLDDGRRCASTRSPVNLSWFFNEVRSGRSAMRHRPLPSCRLVNREDTRASGVVQMTPAQERPHPRLPESVLAASIHISLAGAEMYATRARRGSASASATGRSAIPALPLRPVLGERARVRHHRLATLGGEPNAHVDVGNATRDADHRQPIE
jgi:hypothetical protein